MTMRPACRLAMATLIGGALLAPAAAEIDRKALSKAQSAQTKGEKALKAGNLAEASRQFELAVASVPGYPAALIGLGQLAMADKQFDLALERFTTARDGYALLGDLMFDVESKRYAQAQREIVELRDSISQLQAPSSTSGAAPMQIAQLQNRISQLESVQQPDKTASAEPPGEIFFHIGNALFQLGRNDEAIAAWETCRDKSPKFAMVYNNLALAYGRAGRPKDALASLDKAEELGFKVHPQLRADLERAAAAGG